jgi:hypothetical protein
MMNDSELNALADRLAPMIEERLYVALSARLYGRLQPELLEFLQRRQEIQFQRMLENTQALQLLNDELKEEIKEWIEVQATDAISDHETKFDHNEAINHAQCSEILGDEVDDHIEHHLRHANHGLCTEKEVRAIVEDVLAKEKRT